MSLILDTGAAVTLLRRDVWERTATAKAGWGTLTPWTGPRLVGVNGTALQVSGCKKVQLRIADNAYEALVIVVDTMTAEGILRLDFLQQNRCTIDLAEKILHLADRRASLPLRPEEGQPMKTEDAAARISVCIRSDLQIPARSEVEVIASCTSQAANSGMWLLEATGSNRCAAVATRALVNSNNGEVVVRLLNPREETVTVHKGMKVAELEQVESVGAANIELAETGSQTGEISREKQELLQDLDATTSKSLTEETKASPTVADLP